MAFRHHFPFSLYWHLLWWCKAMVSWYSKVMAPTLLGVTVFFTTKHHCPLPKPVSCKKVLHSFIKSWSWVYILNILGGKMRNAQKVLLLHTLKYNGCLKEKHLWFNWKLNTIFLERLINIQWLFRLESELLDSTFELALKNHYLSSFGMVLNIHNYLKRLWKYFS